MKTNISHKRMVILTALLLLSMPLFSQTNGEPVYLTGSKIGDRLVGDLGMFGGGFAGVGLNFLSMGILSSDSELSLNDRIISSALTELSDIPLFLSGSPDALALSIGGLAVWGGEALADAGYGMYSDAANYLYWAGNDLAMYKAYDSYASYRLQSDAWDNSSFRRYGFMELMAAPFTGSNIIKAQVLLGAASGVLAIVGLLAADGELPFDDSVFATGNYYMGERELNAPAFFLEGILGGAVSATYTAVGEEAVYTGFFHEELCDVMGKRWGTITETAAFTAMHVFTDLGRGKDWKYILCHAAFVAGTNWLSDWAYEEGGLPLTVALHAWTDFAAFMTTAILTGGVPQSREGI